MTPHAAAIRRSRLAAVVVAAATIVSACMPAPATEQATAVRDLWAQFLVASVLVGGTVWILITVALLRYRRPRGAAAISGPADMPAQTHGSTRLEIAWTAIPIVIILVLFWLTMGALGRIDARSPSRVTVDITAYRWQWRFDYPDANVSIVGGPAVEPELVLPIGEPVHIVLTSDDVAHSFYVPAFLFKRDAIPGQPNEFDLTLTDAGPFRGQCAEFCGVFHDRMLLTVRGLPRADFDAWLASQPTGGSPAPSGSTGP